MFCLQIGAAEQIKVSHVARAHTVDLLEHRDSVLEVVLADEGKGQQLVA